MLTLTVLRTRMLFSKQFSFRKSQICFTVAFTCVRKYSLGCRTSMIHVSSLSAGTVLSPFVDVICPTSILLGVVAPTALSCCAASRLPAPACNAVCSSF